MLDRLNAENELFLEMYKGIADEVCIEEAMNWSGYEERKLLENLYNYNNEKLGLIQPKKQRKACSYPFYTLAINPDGDVVCCCVDWTRSTKLGNVREQTLKEIWNSDSLKRFQIMHLEGNRHLNAACRSCETLNRCPEADNIDNVPVEQMFTNKK
jgi:radical SAM protein with 4Fe4S-binding SPASM domain